MPAWATVLLAVVTALIGGSVGAIGARWLQGRHQRAEAWRDRLVPAADDFGTGVLQAILAVRDARRVVGDVLSEQEIGERPPGKSPLDFDDVKAALTELERRIDVAHARLARVQILFGVDEPPTTEGESAILALRRGTTALSEWPIPDRETAERYLNEADDALGRFATAARSAIEAGR